ncbi:aldo/keto reductase [Cellulophaga sp. F20128]|uniref:aldo/keto reductase n=1 Tax=Cellulophaga sp. F20128 TaxID=2926413 RepID=UPI001FF691AF|nr:aldo/keto reductase [Cellulophaga sp. F20128]MCK0156486.1 aldo/keto reductase [Cellulophaga sp. F20128]
MNYNTLGETDLLVSELGFGASGLGGMFEKINESDALNTIHSAFDRGINYFDTSPAYGRNSSIFGPVTSEIILGKGLKDIDRSKIVLSTKAGKNASLPPEFNFKYNSIINSVESSLKRLQTDYIDIVFLHDIEYNKGMHLNLAMSEGLNALTQLKKEGKIRNFGISCYSVDVLQKVIQNYDMDAILVHNHYTLINDLLLDLMPKIKAKKMGLISASPFASGLLTHQGPPDWYPVTSKEICCINKAIQFCSQHNVTFEKIALQFALSNVEIPTTLFSCTNAQILGKNVDWIEEPLDDTVIQEVCSILEPLRNIDFDFGSYND